MSTYYGTCENCENPDCGNCTDNGFTDTNFLTKAVKERCTDCASLVTGDLGEWVCDEAQQPCMAVLDCPEGIELTW